MDNMLTIILALIPLSLGLAWKVKRASFAALQSVGLLTLGVLGVGLFFIQSTTGPGPIQLFLACAVLVAAFCVMLGQDDSRQASTTYASTMVVLGLALGILLHQGLVNRIFLMGLLVYIAFSLIRKKTGSVRTPLILLQMAIAFFLTLSSDFSGKDLNLFSSLFIAVTFIPLVPFHLPFTGTIESAKGALSSFWIVVWLVTGLSELNMIHSQVPNGMLTDIRVLALVSALYASFACLGQQKISRFIASATVAHSALIWGLIDIFPAFPTWGIPFGMTLAFVMGGLCLAFAFIRERYGWQLIGKLPGLADPMPRFGVLVALLLSFAVILPLVPTFSGLTRMPTLAEHEIRLGVTLLMFVVTWLGSGWYFSLLLHQTAFGPTRRDVPYTDLRFAEMLALSALLLGATYSGVIY